jgi:hypothetical protein
MLNQAFAINTAEGAEHDTDKGTVEETVRQAAALARQARQRRGRREVPQRHGRSRIRPQRLRRKNARSAQGQWEGVRQDWLDAQRRDLQTAIANKHAETADA